MGQVISSADRARRGRREGLRQAIQAQIGDKPNAIPSLQFLGRTMKWYRLDDTVVGGMSQTSHSSSIEGDELHFLGRIDIHGGFGFVVSDRQLKMVCQLTRWQYEFGTLGMAKHTRFDSRPCLNRHWRWGKIGLVLLIRWTFQRSRALRTLSPYAWIPSLR